MHSNLIFRRAASRAARVAACAAAVLLSSACDPQAAPNPFRAQSRSELDEAKPGRLVRLPDGRRINFRCSGTGAPTVILESGFGASSVAWSALRPKIDGTHRVCAYDRAGYGFSDPGPQPRDGQAIARDLDRALSAGAIRGPYILVGHSAGALYARLLFNRRPDDVVGLVLAEPSVEHQDRRFAGLAGPKAASLDGIRARVLRCQKAAEARQLPSEDPALASCYPKDRGQRPEVLAARRAESLRPATWAAQASELEHLWGRTSDAVSRGPQDYGSVPVIVLTGGEAFGEVPEPARSAVRALWADLHREIANRSLTGEARVVPGSGHMLLVERPDAIADAVAEITARWKAEGRRR